MAHLGVSGAPGILKFTHAFLRRLLPALAACMLVSACNSGPRGAGQSASSSPAAEPTMQLFTLYMNNIPMEDLATKTMVPMMQGGIDIVFKGIEKDKGIRKIVISKGSDHWVQYETGKNSLAFWPKPNIAKCTFLMTSKSNPPYAALPLGEYLIEVFLSDGNKLEKTASIRNPGEPPGGECAPLVVNEKYTGLMTSGVVGALARPVVLSSSLSEGRLTVVFTVKDSRVSNVSVAAYDGKRKWMGSSSLSPSSEKWENQKWLNGGEPLKVDGMENRIDISLSGFNGTALKTDLPALLLVAVSDGLQYRPPVRGEGRQFWAYSDYVPVNSDPAISPSPAPGAAVSDASGGEPAIKSFSVTVSDRPKNADLSGPRQLGLEFNILTSGIAYEKQLKSVKVSCGGSEWTLFPRGRNILDQQRQTIGQGEVFMYGSTTTKQATCIALGEHKATVVLKDGTALVRTVSLAAPPGSPPDGKAPALPGAAWLYNDEFQDFASPWHVQALGRPAIKAVGQSGSTLSISYAVADRRVNATLVYLLTAKGELTCVIPHATNLLDEETSSVFFSGRLVFSGDGLNEFSCDTGSLNFNSGFSAKDIAKVFVVACHASLDSGENDNVRYMAYSSVWASGTDGRSWTEQVPGSGKAGNALKPGTDAAAVLPDDGLYNKWLLALSGPLAAINGYDFNQLIPMIPSSGAGGTRDKARSVNVLASAWGTYSAEDLRKNIEWCMSEGHNAGYAEIMKLVRSRPGMGLEDLVSLPEAKGLSPDRIATVLRYKDERWGMNILGWDYTRAAMLVRWGYDAGYIGADEAWKDLAAIGSRLSKEFGSWEEVGKNFILGRLYWDGKDPENARSLYLSANKAYVKLLSGKGAWENLSWRIGAERGE